MSVFTCKRFLNFSWVEKTATMDNGGEEWSTSRSLDGMKSHLDCRICQNTLEMGLIMCALCCIKKANKEGRNSDSWPVIAILQIIWTLNIKVNGQKNFTLTCEWSYVGNSRGYASFKGKAWEYRDWQENVDVQKFFCTLLQQMIKAFCRQSGGYSEIQQTHNTLNEENLSILPPEVCRTLSPDRRSWSADRRLAKPPSGVIASACYKHSALVPHKIVPSLLQLLHTLQSDLECVLAAILPRHTATIPPIAVDDQNMIIEISNPMLLTVLH